MTTLFRTIGIIGHLSHPKILSTHKILYHWLIKKGMNVIIEHDIAKNLNLIRANIGNVSKIGQHADLAIIIGGDGNMLSAARKLALYDAKIIGVNRGNLGFLTDLDPFSLKKQLSNVLLGKYYNEKRFLLEVEVCRRDTKINKIKTVINEIVLHSAKIAQMIEFEVYIDKLFAFSQRSDGLIISTPTGSTAYSLSAGGPILIPTLDAIVLVPMFPHTLSSRPLVVNSTSTIQLKFIKKKLDLRITCDNQITLPIKKEEEIFIKRSKCSLNLIHPHNYNYFNTLSSKLGWSKKLF
ncbi:NAD(+) kinase [Candidatus Schneideria nysicola]|uniref:NAD(+) kinase n=1 Tax=Candidatus Schneideria nysicola TaxID=1081631 RepID=UPI001CAA7BC8|nr:NAD(+) kinase [Candidatus Schneideria nysicola]UAJ66216.1 NAD(+) kinase [Candidatus Schneideria nysicola]